MAVTIRSNISALQSERAFARNSASLSEVYQRLSSGQRINRASDDAAGLAVAESLNTDARVFAQGIRNINDGIAAVSIAESALGELSSIVIRIRELATQSSNGTLGANQRKALDEEAQELSKEFLRISKTTKFNGINLTDGTLEELRIQGGFGESGAVVSSLGGAIGTGTVGDKLSIAAQDDEAFEVCTGDLDGDGIADLVTFGRSEQDEYPFDPFGEILLFRGKGDGSFEAAERISSSSPVTLASALLGDVNSDGFLDFVTAGSSQAKVFLNQGDGTFYEAATYETGSSTTNGLALGDLNNDGILDLVTTGEGATTGTATVFIGRGDGTFDSLGTVATETFASKAVSLADLNGDNILDMVTSGVSGATQLSIFYGRGDGTFNEAATLAPSVLADSISFADLDSNGTLDIIAETDIWINQGNGDFAKVLDSGIAPGHSIDAQAVGDLNGDGVFDLAVAGHVVGYNGEATIYLGRGDGTFVESQTMMTEGGPNDGFSSGLCLGDLDGDGVLDIVTAGNGYGVGEVSVFISNTKDGVSPLLPFDLSTMAGARQAQSMLDRKLDQLNAQRGTIGAFESRLEVARNTLDVSRENFKAAESRIKDADTAEEASRLVRLQVLEQASAAILGQANLQPTLAIRLLNSG